MCVCSVVTQVNMTELMGWIDFRPIFTKPSKDFYSIKSDIDKIYCQSFYK